MNRHLAIKLPCFIVVKLRNSPAITCVSRLESEYFNHNLIAPDLISASLAIRRFVAVCPPAEMGDLFENFSKTLCLTAKMAAFVRHWFESEFGKDIWSHISMTQNGSQLAMPGLVIHDENDLDVHWRQGERVAKSWPNGQLIKTTGLGHRRILKDPDTIKRIVDFIRDK